MNKAVEKIAKDKIVEGIIYNVARSNNRGEDLKDLANDIYLELLEKDEEFLNGIYERNQIQYFITRIVLNNINSKTSPYYYKYRKNKKVTASMEDAPIPEQYETPDYY